MPVIRAAVVDDLPALTDIYNYYIVHTAITFDVKPYGIGERRPWFDEHAATGRHRLLVAINEDGSIAGYATTSRWRPKAAYETTVESSVYCRHDARGRGIGRLLYHSLFEAIASEDVHMIVAGATLPNGASVALHERMGFNRVGVFSAVGHKFDRFWDVAWFQRPLRIPNGPANQ
jgi:phosphinothricin acetyltransferase